jgi:ferredoxin-NADP reductase
MSSVWHTATLIRSQMVSDSLMSLRFSVPSWSQHIPGQHVDVRLTAPNGYQAQRSYSLANAPEELGVVELGVQLLQDGEVSPYLFGLQPGHAIELRGPLGGHFIWNTTMPGPLIAIAGGSGIVPFMSMIRHRHTHLPEDSGRAVVLLVSARDITRYAYREELEKLAVSDPHFSLVATLTDAQPDGWTGYSRRIDRDLLTEVCSSYTAEMPMIYICGPTAFVESVSTQLTDIGFNPHEIRTERFG